MQKKIKAAKSMETLLKLAPKEHKDAIKSLKLEDAKITLLDLTSDDVEVL